MELNVSAEVRRAQLNDEFRSKLSRTIGETSQKHRQSVFLLDMVKGITEKVSDEATSDPSFKAAMRLSEYETEEQARRLEFLTNLQKELYPEDYAFQSRD